MQCTLAHALTSELGIRTVAPPLSELKILAVKRRRKDFRSGDDTANMEVYMDGFFHGRPIVS